MSSTSTPMMKLLVALAAASGHLAGAELQLPLPQDFVQGTIFFTSAHTGDLVRLDCKADGCSKPLAIAAGLETYSGLVPWSGQLVAATKSHKLVQVDPWCQDSSCPLKTLVMLHMLLVSSWVLTEISASVASLGVRTRCSLCLGQRRTQGPVV